MERYAKTYKVIALVNSYHSLCGSSLEQEEVSKAIDYCESEIKKLIGKDISDLPVQMDKLIEYLKQ